MSAVNADAPLPQPKVAPVVDLRAPPPQSKGLPSRKVLLAGATVLGGAVAFALITGLSDGPRRVAQQESFKEPQSVVVPETIWSAPAEYDLPATSVSKDLEVPTDYFWGPGGPPPSVAARYEAEQGAAPSEAMEQGASPRTGPAQTSGPDQDSEARDAARSSPILFGRERAIPALPSPRDGPVHPARLEAPAARTIIQAGSVIPAALRTALNSDVPGTVIAQVTAPVYDTLTGEHLLIPQGSRLIGAYEGGATYGDRRMRIVWRRLVLPNGWSMDLSGLEGTDASGAAGLPSRVDDHLDRVAVASLVSGVLSTAANAAQDGESSAFAQSVGDASAQEAARVGGRIVDRELSVRPTLRVPAGAAVRVLVNRDLVLKAYAP